MSLKKNTLTYCLKSKDAIKLHKYLTNYKLLHKQHFAHGEASKTNQQTITAYFFINLVST